MPRNLDMTALRSFVAVADTGGVTKAAGVLHLTQSAVSMQIKRLEESLDLSLFDRSGRGISLTTSGDQLLGYARRMLALNDEAWGRLTSKDYEGEIVIGVPHDIIFPYIPPVLRAFAAEYPRMQARLMSAPTTRLREMFGRGEVDAIVTTEDQPGPGGEVLVESPLVWIGAKGGTAWKQKPLPVAFCSNCIFRSGTLRTLDAAGFDWEMVVESELDNAVEAVVSADLAIHAGIQGAYPSDTAPVPHGGALPELGVTRIILYVQKTDSHVLDALSQMIRNAYRTGPRTEEPVPLTA